MADQSTSEDISQAINFSTEPPFLTEASDSPNFRRSMRNQVAANPQPKRLHNMLRAKSPAIVLLPLEIYVAETPSRWGRCVISHLLCDDYFSHHWSPSLLASNGILGFSISRR